MKKFNLQYFTSDDYFEIIKIVKEQNMSFNDAMEKYSKKNPNKIRDLGVIDEEGNMTKTEVTMEGVETKEVNLEDILNDLINDGNTP
jgi:hypothetical protein